LKSRATVLAKKFHSLPPAGKARLLLAALCGFILLWLLFASKPWQVHVARSGEWKVPQYVAYYVWIAALIDLAVAALLAMTAHWWTRPLVDVPPRENRCSAPRWFWPLVAAAMAINSWICWPRLWQSFWHDENYPLRNAIVGTYRALPDGSLKLKPVSWQATFFFYKKPNHTLYSAIARVCNEA
jgi:hypothetical protein